MTASPQGKRIEQVRRQLAAAGLDQLFVTAMLDIRWLSGFTGSAGACLITPEQAFFFTDFRYSEQAADQTDGLTIVDWSSGPQEHLGGRFAGRVGFNETDLTVDHYERFSKALPDAAEFVKAGGLISKLREIKDAAEIERIAAAAAIGDQIYELLAAEGLGGRSERDVAWRIQTAAREFGAEGLSFPPIVAAGAHGALPHAEPRDRIIEDGSLVVLDLGVIKGGYCSDATRTFAVGDPGEQARGIYSTVLEAQMAALAAIRPGVAGAAVDSAARDVIAGAGHGERFGHSTGHGVGLEVHENPRLGQKSQDVLAAGQIVTVEPGIYLPGKFGVRIEDLVAVTDGEPRILSSFSKEMLIVG